MEFIMMKKVLAAAALASCALSAQAMVTIVAGNNVGPFIDLSTITSDPIYYASGYAAGTMPTGAVGGFISGGQIARSPGIVNPAKVKFGDSATTYASFLWGTPDEYNTLTVKTTSGDLVFNYSESDLTDLFGGPFLGQGAFYVGFQSDDEEDLITGFEFYTETINAFEVANFSVTAVPEPETYALMIAGLGVVGFMARRRKAA